MALQAKLLHCATLCGWTTGRVGTARQWTAQRLHHIARPARGEQQHSMKRSGAHRVACCVHRSLVSSPSPPSPAPSFCVHPDRAMPHPSTLPPSPVRSPTLHVHALSTGPSGDHGDRGEQGDEQMSERRSCFHPPLVPHDPSSLPSAAPCGAPPTSTALLLPSLRDDDSCPPLLSHDRSGLCSPCRLRVTDLSAAALGRP